VEYRKNIWGGTPTRRERQVLQLWSYGLDYQEIADEMGVSIETVKTTAKTAIRRMQARNGKHAVANALRREHIQ